MGQTPLLEMSRATKGGVLASDSLLTVPAGTKHPAERDNHQAMTGMSDEQLEAVRVGSPPPQYQEIVVADYDPIWPHWFESAAFRIRQALAEKVLQLDHVGSTSVRGLPAKPLIDVNLVPDENLRPPVS